MLLPYRAPRRRQGGWHAVLLQARDGGVGADRRLCRLRSCPAGIGRQAVEPPPTPTHGADIYGTRARYASRIYRCQAGATTPTPAAGAATTTSMRRMTCCGGARAAAFHSEAPLDQRFMLNSDRCMRRGWAISSSFKTLGFVAAYSRHRRSLPDPRLPRPHLKLACNSLVVGIWEAAARRWIASSEASRSVWEIPPTRIAWQFGRRRADPEST